MTHHKIPERSEVEVGRALAAIREGALYREQGFGTFEGYCRARWDMGRAHAYRLMDGASVAARLSPIGDIRINEAQARELARLKEPEAQVAAWAAAVKTAPAGGVTAKHVAERATRPGAASERRAT